MNMIITDYCMPGMTGYELLKKIKVINYNARHVNLSILYYRILRVCCFYFEKQESSSMKDVPVVIMSSENVPTRINR